MRCLFLVLLLLGLHSLDVHLLTIDVALQACPVAGYPVHAFAIEGEDVVVAVFYTMAVEIELIAAV